jgi:hypothetical protein
MAAADGTGRARRSCFVPLCAAGLGILCGLWLPGCLNPLPDDQPSSQISGDPVDRPSTPGNELSGAGAGSGEGPAAPNINGEVSAGAREAGVSSDDDPEGNIR